MADRSHASRTPATEGMKGDGYYDAHSEYQRDVAATGLDLLAGAVRAIGAVDGGFTVVDYGSGTGANSARAMRTAMRAYRSLSPGGVVVAVHADLPTNDWNTLFADVTGAHGYLDLGGTILPTAVGTDFFGPCVAPGTAHLGMSFSAAHWLSALPAITAPGTLYFDRATGAARTALAEAAAADWVRFLTARAHDLAPGGRLLVQCLGSVPGDGGGIRASAGALMDLMQDVAERLVRDGSLAEDALAGYVLPVYARTVAQATAPLDEGGALAHVLAVEVAGTQAVPSPYATAYAADHDATGYAASYAAFVRGFSESSLLDGLFRPGARGVSAQVLSERFFAELERRMAAEPGEHAFEDWTLTVLVRRRVDAA